MQRLRKIVARYKHLPLFLATITILVVPACHSDTSQLKQNQTYLATTRIVNHALGEVEIPVSPHRVVVLHDHLLACVMELGFKPIGSTYNVYGEDNQYFRGIPSEWTDSIAKVGVNDQPSLEAVLDLAPDLILGRDLGNSVNEMYYKQLSAIAPTVIVKDSEGYLSQSKYIAEILGRSDIAEKLQIEYEDRIQNLRQQLAENLSNITISVISSVGGGNFVTFSANDIYDQIFNEIGLRRPPIQQNQKEIRLVHSIETLHEHDADVVFVRNFGESPDKFLSFLKQPLVLQLRAAQNNRVYEVHWLGGNYLVANRIIDDLYKYLVHKD
ncbi:iron-siderophore ABC transporter substrate-binding protein [Gloeocapsopsis sp. IPPAS B-1203]|uniref:ABC transporter substrate-binding protein n=1 Tax=Gloeocapsopsis sp. IPPAS B-1203 TaxID=2049454 RepID=UPI0025A26CE5|nr:iron-siderophore ABC transporter substrate-binding protein [Gloeocapsopsis sp. IPPAS B-1203]